MTGADDTAGIYRGWVVVAGCFLGAFVVFGVSYSFGVFLESIQRDLALTRARVSFVFSLHTVVIYLAAVPLGIVADRAGVRRLVLVGAALFAVGMAGTAIAGSLPGLLVTYGLVTAAGLGAIYVVSYATVPRWFARRRGLAAGVATAGLGLGMVVVPPVASVLIASLGWRLALAVVAAGATVLAVVAAALIADDPASRGVDATVEFPDGVPAQPATDWATYRRELWAIASSRRFVLVLAGWVCVYATMYVVFVHLVAHASAIGLGAGVGAVALAVIGATTAVARVVVGGSADRLGRVRTFIACSAVMAAATLALAGVSTAAGLLAFAVVFGIGYGGNGALLSPLTADFFGTANPNAVFGLVSLSFAVSGLLAPWAAGAGFDAAGSYVPAFAAAGLIGLAGVGLLVLADRA